MSRGLTILGVLALVLVLGPVAASAPSPAPTKGATYVGKTSQGKKVTLKISRDGRKIAKLTIGWKASCVCVSGGPCAGKVNYDGGLSSIAGVPLRANGSFSVRGDAVLTGKFVTAARATGTWRERPRVPTAVAELQCDTGTIRWTVRPR